MANLTVQNQDLKTQLDSVTTQIEQLQALPQTFTVEN